MTVTSPFANEERAEGAAFIERLGVEMPEQYGNPASEYQAARHNAGLVDLSFRGMLRLTGGERLRWLNGQITNDVKTLQPGEGRPAAALNAKGHLVADLTVYGLADRVWVDLQRDREEAVRETFETLVRVLRHELGTEPQPETVALFRRLTQAGSRP